MTPGNMNRPPSGGGRDQERKRRGGGSSAPKLEAPEELPKLEEGTDPVSGKEGGEQPSAAPEEMNTPAQVRIDEGSSSDDVDTPPLQADVPETRAEQVTALTAAVNGHAQQEVERNIEVQEGARLSRLEQRENRAKAFAERTGLSEMRDRMVDAENTFKNARKKNLGGLLNLESDEFKIAKAEYEQSVRAWRLAIESKLRDLNEQERIEASIIQKRDTVLRPGMLNTDLKFELLSGNSRKLALHMLGAGASYINKPFEMLGNAFAGNLTGEERKRRAQQVAQSARILAGALAGSALATATAPAAVPLTFFLLAGRGLIASALGVSAGALAAKVGGGVYDQFIRKNAKQKSISALKTLKLSESEGVLKDAQRAVRNNFISRRSTKRAVQVGSGFFGGFLAGRGSGMLFDSFVGDPEAVLRARDVIEAANSQEAHIPEEVSAKIDTTPQTDVVASEPQVPWNEAKGTFYSETVTVGKGEGADALFNKLQIELRSTYPDPQTAPPAVKELLEKSPNQLSREYGFAKGDWSRTMHEGDSLTINKEGVLTFSSGSESTVLGEKPLSVPQEGVKLDLERTQAVAERYIPTPEPITVEVPEPVVRQVVDTTGIELQDGTLDSNPKVSTESSATISESAPQTEAAAPIEYKAPSDIPGEPRTPFTNSYGVTVNPEVAQVFKDQRGNVFVYGGTFEQQRIEAIQYAKQNPNVLVHFEGKPIQNGNSLDRWTTSAISNGTDVISPDAPLSKEQVGQVPDPMRFVSTLGKRGV